MVHCCLWNVQLLGGGHGRAGNTLTQGHSLQYALLTGSQVDLGQDSRTSQNGQEDSHNYKAVVGFCLQKTGRLHNPTDASICWVALKQ